LRYKYLPIFFNKHPTIHALTCHDLRPKKPTGSDSVSLEEVSSSDILLDVIVGVESALREGCPRTTTGVSQRWLSWHFRQVFFSTNALPRINIGADVWGESSIMTGVY
jgi:hypothetical protein